MNGKKMKEFPFFLIFKFSNGRWNHRQVDSLREYASRKKKKKNILVFDGQMMRGKKKKDRYNNQDKFDGRAYSYFFFEWGKEKFIVAR